MGAMTTAASGGWMQGPPSAPALTIVIPTLNAAATLPATLAALGDAHEIVIADSGSTDGTRAACARCR